MKHMEGVYTVPYCWIILHNCFDCVIEEDTTNGALISQKSLKYRRGSQKKKSKVDFKFSKLLQSVLEETEERTLESQLAIVYFYWLNVEVRRKV